MARLHENTTFDPEKKLTELVTELEKEALDEDQVGFALQQMIEGLAQRAECARQLLAQQHSMRVQDQRRAQLKAGIKGVKPVLPNGNQRLIQPASVIPMKAV